MEIPNTEMLSLDEVQVFDIDNFYPVDKNRTVIEYRGAYYVIEEGAATALRVFFNTETYEYSVYW